MKLKIGKVKQLCPGVALERFAYAAVEMEADPGGKTLLIGQKRLTQKLSKRMLPRNHLALSVASLVRLRIRPCLHELYFVQVGRPLRVRSYRDLSRILGRGLLLCPECQLY